MEMYEKPQELVNAVTEQMEICADMLGAHDEKKESKYGFIPGLNEQESEKILRERIKNIDEGIFQVMFTGTFNAGKSTLLNALMHKDTLSTGPKPETAVITKIIFNEPDERVVIFKRDEVDEKGEPVTIVMKDIEEFFKEYHVDTSDTEKFLKLVDHVVLYQKDSGIAGSMVQLVDSPGTRASAADDIVALNFAQKADALVFLINAGVALDKEDKDYIAAHFAKKQMKNVFFVVNKINLIVNDEDIDILEQYVREQLNDVFVDENGIFDEELYQKRVFYVDALGSMNTRMGRETQVTRRRTEMIPDDETGVPEFEAELGEFLTSGDKDKAALSAYRSQMADMYLIAEQSIENQLGILKKSKEAVESELNNFQKEKAKILREIQDIQDDIESSEKDILRDAKDAYEDFVTAVDTEWEDYFSEKSSGMGVHSIKLLTAKAGSILKIWKDKSVREDELKEKTKEATQEFADGINGFIALKNEEMSKQFGIKVKSRLEDLGRKLNNHQENLNGMSIPVDIGEILETIARERNVSIPAAGENNAKLGQALTAILLGDPELVVTSTQGDKGAIDFLVDVIKTNVMDLIISYILLYIFGNIVGIIFFIIAKLVKAGVRGENMTEKLIAETKNTIINGSTDKDGNLIPGLRNEGRTEYNIKTEAVIGGAMLRASYKLTEGINNNLSAIERQLKYALAQKEKGGNVLLSETQRMGKIKKAMEDAISKMSRLTTGNELTAEEIKLLASRYKK